MKYLIFLILKIVEIVVVVFVPYYAGRMIEIAILYFWPAAGACPFPVQWLVGIAGMGCMFLLSAGLYHLCIKNWQWSETIWLKIKTVLEKK